MNEVEKIISSARDKYTVHNCGECAWRKCCSLGFGSADCMSRRESIFLKLGIEDGYFSKLLDDIEAAHKRELAEWEAAACACVSDAVMSGKVAVEHKLVCNAAAMREALLRCEAISCLPEIREQQSVRDMRNIIAAALSAPPRNCDAGTPDEQADRFFALCNSNKCSSCPCRFTKKTDCALIWAQMPYAAEV